MMEKEIPTLNEEKARLCFMARECDNDHKDNYSYNSETECELSDFTYGDFLSQMDDLRSKLNVLQIKNKKKKKLIFELGTELKTQKSKAYQLHVDEALAISKVQCFQEETDVFKKENDDLKRRESEISDKFEKSELERIEFVNKFNTILKEKTDLEANYKILEDKLYKRGQTDQTIHLNNPNEFKYYNSKWGIGYNNPQYFKKAYTEARILYDYDMLGLGDKLPRFKVKWTKSSDEVEEQEDLRRNNHVNVQIPFLYDSLNKSYEYEPEKYSYLSNDYFASYTNAEMKANPTERKIYAHPLILENKIVQLEKNFKEERNKFENEKDALLTRIKDLESKSLCQKSSGKSTSMDENGLFGTNSLNFDGCLSENACKFDFNKPLPSREEFLVKESKIVFEEEESDDVFEEEAQSLESENIELQRKISELQKILEKEREDCKREKEGFANEKKLLLQKHSDFSKKAAE